jgi:putative acetyltransferase
MKWTFHEDELSHGDVHALLGQHFAEMRAGSPPSACHVLTPEALEDKAIRLFTARDEMGALLGCGALKRLAGEHGEIKSMRTSDAALGLGVGGRILGHLTATAQAAGMTRLSLETGNGEQFAAANRLYEREGFELCSPFGGYIDTPFTRFFTKSL